MFPEDLHQERYNEEEDVDQQVVQEEFLCLLELIVDNVSDDWRLVTVIGEFIVDSKHVIGQFKLSYLYTIGVSDTLNGSDSVDVSNTIKVKKIMLNIDIPGSTIENLFLFGIWHELLIKVDVCLFLLEFTKS
jgi:hypothetical protein